MRLLVMKINYSKYMDFCQVLYSGMKSTLLYALSDSPICGNEAAKYQIFPADGSGI